MNDDVDKCEQDHKTILDIWYDALPRGEEIIEGITSIISHLNDTIYLYSRDVSGHIIRMKRIYVNRYYYY